MKEEIRLNFFEFSSNFHPNSRGQEIPPWLSHLFISTSTTNTLRMSLNPESFTDKTNEYISAARNLALEGRHVQITPLHLALAILADPEGLGKQICNKAQVDPIVVERALKRAVNKLPAQEPAPE
jgi:hypothetical protein